MPKSQRFELRHDEQVRIVDFDRGEGKRLYFGNGSGAYGWIDVDAATAEVEIGVDGDVWLWTADNRVVTSMSQPETPRRLAIELCRGIDATVVDERGN